MKRKIRYSYCLDEEKNLVHISDAISEQKNKRQYECLECGKKMHVRIKNNTPFFAHNPGVSCHGESYLHKLAKRRIREYFDNKDGELKLKQKHDVICSSKDECIFFNSKYCRKKNESIFNLKDYYNKCGEEVPIKEFVADLLLSNSDKEEREPVLIEVLVTSECKESKINSGLRIIETKPIEDEADIDNIIKKGFIEGENCKLYNFKELPRLQVDNRPINRFILHSSGGATIKIIKCGNMSDIVEPDSIAELNIDGDKLKKYPSLFNFAPLPNIYVGLIYLKRKGFDIKNCFLCKYHCIKKYTSRCNLFKNYGTPKSPRQTSAKQCQYYRVSEKIKNEINGFSYGLHEIVEEVKGGKGSRNVSDTL